MFEEGSKVFKYITSTKELFDGYFMMRSKDFHRWVLGLAT